MPETLRRSETNKVVAGVCGGIGEYFKVDPTIIRLAWALMVFLGGSGLILYILAIIIIPQQQEKNLEIVNDEESRKDENQNTTQTTYVSREKERHQILGAVLICVGGYFLIRRYLPFLRINEWWPVILIILGIFIILKGRDQRR